MIYELPKQVSTMPCRACGRAIAFVLTPKGHRMPVDVAGETRGHSHYESCTDPKRFRKRDRLKGAQGVLEALDAVKPRGST